MTPLEISEHAPVEESQDVLRGLDQSRHNGLFYDVGHIGVRHLRRDANQCDEVCEESSDIALIVAPRAELCAGRLKCLTASRSAFAPPVFFAKALENGRSGIIARE